MINKLIVKAIKSVIEARLGQVIKDIRRENESVLDAYRREYVSEWERKAAAEQSAYNKLKAEIDTEAFIDKIVLRIKNKQL